MPARDAGQLARGDPSVPRQVVIENPAINSPFEEPRRHFDFDDEGITDRIVEQRRKSAYFVPIAQPRKRGRQLALEAEWTKDRIEENKLVNEIRQRVGAWRGRGYAGMTHTTRRLLDHWLGSSRGPDDPVNLIVEVTVARDKDKEAKVATARNLWVPAVNNAGTWGRWAFVEIDDPWNSSRSLRACLRGRHGPAGREARP